MEYKVLQNKKWEWCRLPFERVVGGRDQGRSRYSFRRTKTPLNIVRHLFVNLGGSCIRKLTNVVTSFIIHRKRVP